MADNIHEDEIHEDEIHEDEIQEDEIHEDEDSSPLVVAEDIWWHALDNARLSRNTISFFTLSRKPETTTSRWNRISLNASMIGKGLSQSTMGLKLAFQHYIEAIDSKHRYGHNLLEYYKTWHESDTNEPFFYWLDIGEGKDVDLEECRRSKLVEQEIEYLSPIRRKDYEYLVVGGKIIKKQTRALLDTRTGARGPTSIHIFVMSTSKRLYVGEKIKGRFHHSSFLSGGATLAAGRLVVEEGVLKYVSASSGHYRPKDRNLKIFLEFLKENGVDMEDVQIEETNEDHENFEGKEWSKSDTLGEPEGIRTGVTCIGLSIPINVERTERSINYKMAGTSSESGNQPSLEFIAPDAARVDYTTNYPVEVKLKTLGIKFSES